MILDLPEYIASRRKLWQEYEEMLDSLEQGTVRNLDLDRIKRLRYLHEALASDLVRIRTYLADQGTTQYLESLVARGFGFIHENRTGLRFSLNPTSLMVRFAVTVRKHVALLWLSTSAMSIGLLFGIGIIVLDYEAKEVVMPFSHLMLDPSERVAGEESRGAKDLGGIHAAFSAELMTHNIRVSIFVLALGLIYGVFSMIILFYNGIILGAVIADYILGGETVFLVGWLLPHGSVEIPAILFAGQAAFLLARTVIIRDGRLSLGTRLKQQSGDIVTLIGGIAVLLIWAAVVESFFSQYHEPVLPYSAKIAFGLVQLLGLCALLLYAGRTRAIAAQ